MVSARQPAAGRRARAIYPGRSASIGRLLALVIWTENMSKYVKIRQIWVFFVKFNLKCDSDKRFKMFRVTIPNCRVNLSQGYESIEELDK